MKTYSDILHERTKDIHAIIKECQNVISQVEYRAVREYFKPGDIVRHSSYFDGDITGEVIGVDENNKVVVETKQVNGSSVSWGTVDKYDPATIFKVGD